MNSVASTGTVSREGMAMELNKGPYVVHGISKGPKQEVRIALSEFKGKRRVDLRLYVRTKHGEWIATQRGCSVAIEQIGELELAVGRLRQALERVPPLT